MECKYLDGFDGNYTCPRCHQSVCGLHTKMGDTGKRECKKCYQPQRRDSTGTTTALHGIGNSTLARFK